LNILKEHLIQFGGIVNPKPQTGNN